MPTQTLLLVLLVTLLAFSARIVGSQGNPPPTTSRNWNVLKPITSFVNSIQSSAGMKNETRSIELDFEKSFFNEEQIGQALFDSRGYYHNKRMKLNPAAPLPANIMVHEGSDRAELRERRPRKWFSVDNFPNIHLHCDPLINFKLVQRLKLLGACVTLGLDYLSDISQWRTHCSIEDTVVRGRFSLRGSELGWAKSWIVGLGLGDENTAKFKLRMGLNLKTWKLYGKLRFRTEPISPFDIGDGLSCAGKLPLPLYILPMLRSIPFRVEYRLRVNAARPDAISRRSESERKVYMTTGLGTLDVSLDELNFCLEYDEAAPLWGIGLVRNDPTRRSGPQRSLFSTLPSLLTNYEKRFLSNRK